MSTVYIGIDPSGSYRVYLTDSTELVQRAQDIHQTTPLATAGLGRVLTGAGIMSLLLKEQEDRLTVIFRGDGPAKQILAVGRGDGQVKGYIANPAVELPLKENGKLDVGGSLGEGDLTVIKDLGLKEPWHGTIALVSGEIAEDLTAYYYVSEQQNTSFALGVKIGTDGRVAAAGGLFIQMLPGAEEGAISALEGLLGSLPPITTIVSAGRKEAKEAKGSQEADPKDLAAHIFREMPTPYRPEFLEYRRIEWACDCSRDKMAAALLTIGEEELSRLAREDRGAELTCHFCGARYRFSEEELDGLRERATKK